MLNKGMPHTILLCYRRGFYCQHQRAVNTPSFATHECEAVQVGHREEADCGREVAA
jgi:hypothetical protein